ncbi:TadE/TadG family type IV pilus assembly protein [Actibacterium lipolyticum]|uniref:Pilus assembly protein n=1 Tax=Actibacterium lipolyticum TaxID=1524263 RepID=A0A238JS20_9RHOB|nr:hypothetical protein [Actibacterium lipolyticum]SMX33375.1 hypothetical protein COL8621_01011 [Actibacterium lipolyticum]
MFNTLKNAIARFRSDESGLITAEAVLAMPVLVWWYVGSLVFFDAYQARNVNLKAAYTISDMLSRELASAGPNYIQGLDNVYGYLTAGHGTGSKIRVTMVKCNDDCEAGSTSRELVRSWSEGTGDLAPLSDGDLDAYQKYIPVMAKGDWVILAETFIDYDPAWQVGIVDPTDFDNVIVTRPRFLPQIPWDPNA